MIIGITGSFGSGKTTAASMFERLGAYVIDMDKECNSLLASGQDTYRRIVRHFGRPILKKDSSIDRKKLANIVFKNERELNKLNKIIHPEVIKLTNRIISAKKEKFIIVDAPLLVEAGYYKEMDKLIVVRTDRDRQIKRMMRARNMKRCDVLRRIRMQAPLRRKLALADFIINNNGSKKQTLFQVIKIWKQLGVCHDS